MADNDRLAVNPQDPVVTSIRQAITEIEKRKNDKPLQQLAQELDDVLRRYVLETAFPREDT